MSNRVTELKTNLNELLFANPNVCAAWEGGSIATGYSDQFSDLDLSIVVSTGSADSIFMDLETFFKEHYGILDQFRMPEPSWHGMSQCFYLIDKMPPYFYCDIAVVMADNPRKFTEPERHGNAVIWFDKQGVYQSTSTPKDELDALVKRFYHIAVDTSFLGIIELQKAIARDNWIAAQMNYNTFINRHLVILLNLKYRPEKVDFGIRYSDRDYPPETATLLADLLRISSVEDIKRHLETALPLFNTLSEEMTHYLN